jgi:hypothetical protein
MQLEKEASTYVKGRLELYLRLGVILFCLELVEAPEGTLMKVPIVKVAFVSLIVRTDGLLRNHREREKGSVRNILVCVIYVQ